MSDLAHHQTEAVYLIFLGMGKSDIMHTDHNYVDYVVLQFARVFLLKSNHFLPNSYDKSVVLLLYNCYCTTVTVRLLLYDCYCTTVTVPL